MISRNYPYLIVIWKQLSKMLILMLEQTVLLEDHFEEVFEMKLGKHSRLF